MQRMSISQPLAKMSPLVTRSLFQELMKRRRSRKDLSVGDFLNSSDNGQKSSVWGGGGGLTRSSPREVIMLGRPARLRRKNCDVVCVLFFPWKEVGGQGSRERVARMRRAATGNRKHISGAAWTNKPGTHGVAARTVRSSFTHCTDAPNILGFNGCELRQNGNCWMSCT